MRRAVFNARYRLFWPVSTNEALVKAPAFLPQSSICVSTPSQHPPAQRRPHVRFFQSTTHRHASETIKSTPGADLLAVENLTKLEKLPSYCSGCGAPSQIVSPDEAGFFTLTRTGLRKFLREAPPEQLDDRSQDASASVLCDRCHNLLNHHEGVPIFHPSIQSIHDIIEESPHRHNHIYHILDAADLPMSLIPSLQTDLRLPRLRSQNRRSKHVAFAHGRSAEVSFIITRADLLAPKKEQVDSLLPYLREVLRDALGRTNKNVRLGNLRCVSSKRGWWTKHVKEDIWNRGGAGWMVGKVNVGKSSLFESVFPKGRSRKRDSTALPSNGDDLPDLKLREPDLVKLENDDFDDLKAVSDYTLLPPVRAEVAYPAMPIASSLPGTTASPIRVPFGSGKGELIDLPGVARSSLEEFVLPEARQSLVMTSRIAAEQHVIKPGQSLLLGGGLIRITSSDPDQIILAYPFVPLSSHVTSNTKAEELQASGPRPGIPSVLASDAHSRLKSAGTFNLSWDVTKARAGPLTSKSDAKLRTTQLSFTIWAADLVIEGVGWVELVAQTRKPKRVKDAFDAIDQPDPFPETMRRQQRNQSAVTVDGAVQPQVQIFSPDGKHIAIRRPMNAWLLGGRRVKSQTPGKSRPRRSMTSLKQSRKGREMAVVAGASTQSSI